MELDAELSSSAESDAEEGARKLRSFSASSARESDSEYGNAALKTTRKQLFKKDKKKAKKKKKEKRRDKKHSAETSDDDEMSSSSSGGGGGGRSREEFRDAYPDDEEEDYDEARRHDDEEEDDENEAGASAKGSKRRWRLSSKGAAPRAAQEGESMVESAGGDPLTLVLKWNRSEFVLQMNTAETVEDLHDLIELETGVQPGNQKIFGLKVGSRPVARLSPETCMGEFGVADGHVIKMMGSPDTLIDEMEEAAAAAAGLKVVDDLDFDYSHADVETELHMAEAREALQDRIDTTTIHVMNPPRPGKGLLVLDLDHTLLDFGYRKYSSSVEDLKRPFMDQFLATTYKYFDIVAWSQTRWHYVELKLTELGIISHSDYKICFALDRTSMFKVTREHNGETKRHEVKALELIWAKFPQWSSKNTVHIDDLARNFALNPQSGLQCSAFKRRRSRAANDRELLEIAAYLEHISEKGEDFSRLDHSRWRECLQRILDRGR